MSKTQQRRQWNRLIRKAAHAPKGLKRSREAALRGYVVKMLRAG